MGTSQRRFWKTVAADIGERGSSINLGGVLTSSLSKSTPTSQTPGNSFINSQFRKAVTTVHPPNAACLRFWWTKTGKPGGGPKGMHSTDAYGLVVDAGRSGRWRMRALGSRALLISARQTTATINPALWC